MRIHASKSTVVAMGIGILLVGFVILKKPRQSSTASSASPTFNQGGTMFIPSKYTTYTYNVTNPVEPANVVSTPTPLSPPAATPSAPVNNSGDPYNLQHEENYLSWASHDTSFSPSGQAWANETLYLMKTYNDPGSSQSQKDWAKNYAKSKQGVDISLYK